jgi:hypothetical protein
MNALPTRLCTLEESIPLYFPVYNVMHGPEATESEKTRKMVVVDFQRKIFENHGLDRSYVLRELSPYLEDVWGD